MNLHAVPKLRSLLFALSLLSGATGCASTSGGSEPSASEYVFVFLKTGPATDLTKQAQQEAFQGHFSNMGRMADVGQLLMAGPMGDPKSDPDHRGLWMFDTNRVEQALEWARTDPTVQLGVFVLEAYEFETEADLNQLRDLDRQEEAERLADPEIPDEWQGRGYLLASLPVDVPGASALFGELADRPGIALAGRLRSAVGDPSGEGESSRWLAWLLTSDEAEARKFLPNGDAWTLHGWYGSKMVAELGR